MPQTIPISIRLTPEKICILGEMAKKGKHSRNHLINLAIDTYLEMRQQWDEGIEEAIREVKAGIVVPAEEVFSRLEKALGI